MPLSITGPYCLLLLTATASSMALNLDKAVKVDVQIAHEGVVDCV